MKFLNRTLLAGTCLTVSALSVAQTTVSEAWIRGTVSQQKTTGMFAQIMSKSGGQLVSASTPVAGIVEIHEMAMEGQVMKMRVLPNGLPLPAGKAVSLAPGGFHIMMMDLKQPLKVGEKVPVSLVVRAQGKTEVLNLDVEVRPMVGAVPAAKTPNAQDHAGHDASAHGHKH